PPNFPPDSGELKVVPSVSIPTSLDNQLLANINGRDGKLPTVEGFWLMFSWAKIISIAFERPCCAERNFCKSVLGSGIVNWPFTSNCGINRIKPSGLHNNSDCTDKAAALERDEADTATAKTTVLISIAEFSQCAPNRHEFLRFSRALASQAAVASSI